MKNLNNYDLIMMNEIKKECKKLQYVEDFKDFVNDTLWTDNSIKGTNYQNLIK